ncbi:MAG: alanine/glycine:cation symporter family protein [Candidatus Latescibacterota bacterium]|nr:alanine/glycine:cation symporter family protein [Candidatus Latescibacterota bacterium]
MRQSSRAVSMGIALLVAITLSPATLFAQEASSEGWIQSQIDSLNEILGLIVSWIFFFLFYDFGTGLPLIIIVLVSGGFYYTVFFGWLSLRGFTHSIDVIRGRYDNPDDPGEISHFQALTSALSATVGLGNIGGVAIAVGTGGPGAVFWMLLTALFGMSSKLASCTLAVMYRNVREDGHISGGPMYYLEHGLAKKGLKSLGRTLAVFYAFLVIGGSFGGGNMFQANQTIEVLSTVSPIFKELSWLIGIIMAGFVAVVIIGGIRRIGNVTSRLVPGMCILYVATSLLIILSHAGEIPTLLGRIMSEAFTGPAIYGGFLGVLITGVRRAAFSNEAGLGSAAFAHAAAKTDEPAREGIVAMIGPFIDTIVICLMTALVCMITGVFDDPELKNKGVAMTAAAFESFVPGARYVLSIAVVLFAYSTMISWSYYGERAWEYLFGDGSILIYRTIFVGFVFVGSITALKNVLDFSDAMILGMAFPNIIGGIILSPQIKEVLNEYWDRYKSGEMKRYK